MTTQERILAIATLTEVLRKLFLEPEQKEILKNKIIELAKSL